MNSLAEAREKRIRAALHRRLGRVRCAVESVHHRHNISAILRTCESLGIQHVHLIDKQEFLVSKGPARGSERWLDIHQHTSPDDAIAALRAAGFAIWIADLRDPPTAPEAVPVDRPVCLWFGAELIGVGPEVKAVADGVVTVPMHGLSQSLNVSVAAALALRPVAERARALGPASLLDPQERDALAARWFGDDPGQDPE